MIVDFHGHSGATNIFMYGNEIEGNPNESKVFPMLIFLTVFILYFGQLDYYYSVDEYFYISDYF